MDYSALASQIKTKFPGIDIHLNHPLAPYTTLNIGGPADLFIHTTTRNQFLHIVKLLHQNTIKPPTILGHGSNVLISDSGIRGVVIKNSGNHISINHTQVTLSSGTSLPYAINFTLDKNLIGLEVFAYIPATIGGAVHSNIHGFDHSNFSQFIDTIQIFNYHTGQTQTLKTNDFDWSYDLSPFQSQSHLIITSVTLNLKKGNGKLATTKAEKIKTIKQQTQPLNSAGCVFKNPPTDSAGRIIDSLGLKGKTIGQVQISPLHANFIVNLSHATAADYLKLIELIRQKVKTKYRLDLDLEIKLLGKF